MNATDAWRYALNNLQQSMTVPTFNQWVGSAQFVSFDGTDFVISVPDKAAQEWVVERLASMLTRLLSGVLNCSVNLCVVINDSQTNVDSTADRTLCADDLDNPVGVHVDNAAGASLYEYFVQPKRIVICPGYFVRWSRHLDPEAFLLYIAFCQCAYLAAGRTSWDPRDTFSTAVDHILEWAGGTINESGQNTLRATYFRSMPKLRRLITRIDTGRNLDNGLRNPSDFRINPMPLTPEDGYHLWALLMQAESWRDPIAACQKILALPPREIFYHPQTSVDMPDYIIPAPVSRGVVDGKRRERRVRDGNTLAKAKRQVVDDERCDPYMAPVQAIVRWACGADRLQHDLLREVESLADRIAEHLIPPNQFIVISHYFLKNWVPLLGSRKAVLVLWARSKCYYNPRTGELRNQIAVDRGPDEISDVARCGTRAVWEWFFDPSFADRIDTQSLRSFITVNDRQKRGDGSSTWLLDVQMHEPLTPEHQEEYDTVLNNLFWLGAPGAHLPVGSGETGVLYPVGSKETRIPDPVGSGETRFFCPAGLLETLESDPVGSNETGCWVLRDCFKYLKYLSPVLLFSFLNTLNEIHQTTTSVPPAINSTKIVFDDNVVVGGQWSIDGLLLHNQVRREQRSALKDKDPRYLVAWLLYAAGKEGAWITKPGGDIGLAIRRLEENDPPGDPYNMIARLPPEDLARMIATSYRPGDNFNWPGNVPLSQRQWEDIHRPQQLETLVRRLGIRFVSHRG